MELLVTWVMRTVLLLQQWQGIISLLSITAVCRVAFKLVANRSGKCPEWEKKKNVLEVGMIGPGEGGEHRGVGCLSITASARQPITPWLKVASRILKGFSKGFSQPPMRELRMALSV